MLPSAALECEKTPTSDMADAAEVLTGLESEITSWTHMCSRPRSITGSIFVGGRWACCVSNPGVTSPQVFAAEHDHLG